MARPSHAINLRLNNLRYRQAAASRPMPQAAQPRHDFAVWLMLIGLILPAWEMQIQIAGGKFTVGRAGVTLLLVPAICLMLQRGRRFLLVDWLAILTASWCIGISIYSYGSEYLATAGAVSLEFLGGYMAGRAYLANARSLDKFMRVLKVLTVAALVLALADNVTRSWVTHDVAGKLFGMPALQPVFRGGMVRATASFDHPILFGVFCSIVAGIFLFWERTTGKRVLWVGICFAGCALSQSSASFLCLMLIVVAFAYERIMSGVAARWTAFWGAALLFIVAVILVTDNPLGWIISHLTLDPETGYYRILIWEKAFQFISYNPITGYAGPFGDQILDATIDSVWLVFSLGYGIPMAVLLFVTNVAAILSGRRAGQNDDSRKASIRLGFSVALIIFMFSGLTVYFWNYIWIFWGICIGARASIGQATDDFSAAGNRQPQDLGFRQVRSRSF